MNKIASLALRAVGKGLDTLGQKFEVLPYIERLQPSIRSLKLGKHTPSIAGVFIASSATVMGQVKIGINSSVGFSSVLRGDANTITIGDAVTIGDNTMIHCDGPPRPSPVTIGNRVIIGNGATVHGAILEDECVVGDRATVLDLAIIRKHGVLAPGSLLAGGKEIKTGELWAGCPAKFQRTLSLAEVESIAVMAAEGVEVAALHTKDDKLNYLDLYNERDEYYQISNRAEYYHQRLTPAEMAHLAGDVEGHQAPGRVLNSNVSARENKESRPYMD